MILTKDMYKVSELAQILHVSSRTIYNWINAGRVKALRLGPSSTRVTRREIQRLLDLGGGNHE
jgi:excisionase family DNA binding protein